MKRVAVVVVVVVTTLLGVLTYKLRERRLEAARPAGGSATIEGTEVAITARLAARIAAINVEEGDRVAAGDPLVVLECADTEAMLAQAEAAVAAATIKIEAAGLGARAAAQGAETARRQSGAALAAADATLAQRRAIELQRDAAQRAAARVASVQAEGVVSEQALDRARAEAAGLGEQAQAVAAQARGTQAQAGVAAGAATTAQLQAELAAVQARAATQELIAAEAARARARIAVAECTLVAPRAGVVETRAFEPGEAVLPGSRVLTLVNTAEVRATFYLPNAELAAAAPGRAVNVVADAYPGRRFAGVIRRVAESAEFTPRNVQTRDDRDRLVYAVEVRVPNPDGALRPGMPVEIRVALPLTPPRGRGE